MGKWNYDKGQKEPYNISRSKIDLFIECPRCFYMDQVLSIKRPRGPSWPLNSAVDSLFKNEFDHYREAGKPHPLMEKYKLNLIPLKHPDLPAWRDDDNLYLGAKANIGDNMTLSGIVDDIWVDEDGLFHIVDYKSTSTDKEIDLEDKYKQGYKRQMEVYQYIFRKMGFEVSERGFFVYANALKDSEKFDDKLVFKTVIIEHRGDTNWIDGTLSEIKELLNSDECPEHGPDCEYSRYLKLVKEENVF